jgi:DNA-binding NarL/FixJ family response regulator
MYKIVIADDHPISREGAKMYFEMDGEFEVVGCVSNGMEAYNLCKEKDVDAVLMDIRMPECDGIEGTRLIKGLNKPIKVIVLSSYFQEDNLVAKAIKNNADSYILKGIEKGQLISAVKATIIGISSIDNKALEELKDKIPISNSSISDKVFNQVIINNLNSSENNVLKLLVEGKTNKEIGKILFLQEDTVRNIVSRLITTFELSNRTQLAVFAIKNNLV